MADLWDLDDEHQVRWAVQEDVPRLADIWLEGAGAAIGAKEGEMPTHLEVCVRLRAMVNEQTDNFKFWVCVRKDGYIVGWSTVQPIHTTPLAIMRNAIGLISTYFSRDCRSRGTGGRLVEFVTDYARQHTAIDVILGFQDRGNEPSVRITDRLGYVNYGELPYLAGLAPTSVIACATRRPSS